MIHKQVILVLIAVLPVAATIEAAELSVANLTIPPGGTGTLVVSGDVYVPCYAVTIAVHLVPRAGNTGTVEFTPGPIDIAQLNHPWTGTGTQWYFDSEQPPGETLGPWENFYIDLNDTCVNEPVTFTGPLAGFPVVASVDASGVWDVTLVSPICGTSEWNAYPVISTTLFDGTITILAQECVDNSDCDDGLYCNGGETCDGNGICQPGTYPCVPGAWCDEGGDACIAHGNGDFDGDDDRDLADFAAFQACFTQAAGGGCEPSNMTGIDETIDLDDAALFIDALTGS